jgi:hypothetical protein
MKRVSVVYFHDHLSSEAENQEEIASVELVFNTVKAARKDFSFTLKVFERDIRQALTSKFDIFVFDYGALGCLGGDQTLQDVFSDDILYHAKEHPSKYYIISSNFTMLAINEFLAQNKTREMPSNMMWPRLYFGKDFNETVDYCVSQLLLP